MTDKDLGAAAGDIFAKAFTLGYETGRTYIPAGGMALTAEQVEDVRTMLLSPGVTALEAFRRLRALFPATEPAEQPALEGDCALLATHDGPCRPAPAEPAEEETKAEESVGTVCDETQKAYDEAVSLSYWLAKQLGEHVDDAYDRGETLTDTVQRLIEHIRPNRGKTKTVSSPVVPAPTETGPQTLEGPWDRIEDVPDGVEEVSDCDGHLWWLSRNVVEEWHFDGTDPSGTKQFKDPSDFAPLFAIKEES